MCGISNTEVYKKDVDRQTQRFFEMISHVLGGQRKVFNLIKHAIIVSGRIRAYGAHALWFACFVWGVGAIGHEGAVERRYRIWEVGLDGREPFLTESPEDIDPVRLFQRLEVKILVGIWVVGYVKCLDVSLA